VGRARARLAAATRHHPDDDHITLERDLEYAKAEDRVRRIADSILLTDEQLAKLVVLLQPRAGELCNPGGSEAAS